MNYVRNIKFEKCKDVQMMRNQLINCYCKPVTIDVVEGNVAVLAKVYIGDRTDTSLKFELKAHSQDQLTDIQTFVSTQTKLPSDQDYMSMYINQSHF